MIRTILGFIGYAKIPQEIVILSEKQEAFLRCALACESDKKARRYLSRALEGQRTMTEFLMSCRLLARK